MGFFEVSQRYEGLDHKGDPLQSLAELVPWEDYRPKLKTALRAGGLRNSAAVRKSPAGP